MQDLMCNIMGSPTQMVATYGVLADPLRVHAALPDRAWSEGSTGGRGVPAGDPREHHIPFVPMGVGQSSGTGGRMRVK